MYFLCITVMVSMNLLSQCRCIPQYCHGAGYCWWCNVTCTGTGWGAGGAGGRGGGATGNDSLDARLASFWFRVTWLFSWRRFLAYTGSENVNDIKTLTNSKHAISPFLISFQAVKDKIQNKTKHAISPYNWITKLQIVFEMIHAVVVHRLFIYS